MFLPLPGMFLLPDGLFLPHSVPYRHPLFQHITNLMGFFSVFLFGSICNFLPLIKCKFQAGCDSLCPAVLSLGQENDKFEGNLSHVVRLSLNKRQPEKDWKKHNLISFHNT